MASEYVVRRGLPIACILVPLIVLICIILYVNYPEESNDKSLSLNKRVYFGGVKTCWSNISLEDYPSLRSFVLNRDKQTQTSYQESPNYGNLLCKSKRIMQISLPVVGQENNETEKLDGPIILKNGNLNFNEHNFSNEEYCIESVTQEVIKVATCDLTSHCSNNADKAGNKPCLFRCCNYGEVWDISKSPIKCKDSGEHKWSPVVYPNIHSNESKALDEISFNKRPVIAVSHPRVLRHHCKANYTFEIPNLKLRQRSLPVGLLFGDKQFKVLKDGTVWMNHQSEEWGQLQPGEYCIDGFQFGEGTYSGDDDQDFILFECKLWTTPDELRNLEKERKYALSLGIIQCCCLAFLLLTIIVYILLWSNHNNIHGWTVFSYITSMFITYGLTGASHFSSVLLGRRDSHDEIKLYTFCGVLGVLSHFSFLCTFSWSTVLSFDLFRTFRTLRPRRSDKRSDGKKFFLYCLFAFLVPALVVCTGIYLDVTYSFDDDVITPDYGKSVCYVEPQFGRIYFVIIPIAVLLGANFVLFCNTAYAVFKAKKSAQFATINSTKKEANNQTFHLIFKLFLINGSVWAVEIISWIMEEDYNKVGLISFLLDIVNILQAVAIFFLFVFKDDILEALRRKYPALQGVIDFAFKLKKLGRCDVSGPCNGPRTSNSCAMKPLTSTASVDTCRTVKTQVSSTCSVESSFSPSTRLITKSSFDAAILESGKHAV